MKTKISSLVPHTRSLLQKYHKVILISLCAGFTFIQAQEPTLNREQVTGHTHEWHGFFQASNTPLHNEQSKKTFQKKVCQFLRKNLENQAYWKDILTSSLKKYITGSPALLLSTFFGQKSADALITEHIQALKEFQSLLAYALSYYNNNITLNPKLEEDFLKYCKTYTCAHSAPAWYTQHWISLSSVVAGSYLLYSNKKALLDSVQKRVNQATDTIKDALREIDHGNDHLQLSVAIPRRDMLSLTNLKESIVNFYCKTKDSYLEAKNNYRQALLEHVKALFREREVMVNPARYTINQLQTLRDRTTSLLSPFKNKLKYFLKTEIFESLVGNGSYLNRFVVNTPQSISAADQTYIDSLQAEAHYYVETGKASGKALLAAYAALKLGQIIKKIAWKTATTAYYFITKKPSFKTVQQDLIYCERLLNHARTAPTNSPFYEGMLTYFVTSFEQLSAKIPGAWKQRWNDDLEDLKNSALSFEQKHATLAAAMRDYTFLQD